MPPTAPIPIRNLAEHTLRGYARLAPTGRGMFRLARAVRALRPRTSWTGTFHPFGLSMDLDLAVYPDICMAYGAYERDTERWIRKLLRPGGHFIDGGANIGYFTLIAAQQVGTKGRVDAFEPVSTTRTRLVHHLHQSQLADRVTVHPQALSDQQGTATIHVFEGVDHNHGESSLFPAPGAKTIAQDIETVRLDEHLADARPTLIKLDLEGAEAVALRGMRGLLASTDPPALIVEYDARHQATAGEQADAVIRAVRDVQPKYKVFVIGARLRPIDGSPESLAGLGQVNLLFRAGD